MDYGDVYNPYWNVALHWVRWPDHAAMSTAKARWDANLDPGVVGAQLQRQLEQQMQ